jgi:hypothetical protein
MGALLVIVLSSKNQVTAGSYNGIYFAVIFKYTGTIYLYRHRLSDSHFLEAGRSRGKNTNAGA